jgi:hypothetical protein
MVTAMENRKRVKPVKKSVGVTGCSHVFKATPEKGMWVVEAIPTNNRGGPKKVEVTVTVFKCVHCGESKEYPDFWEMNFVMPKLPMVVKARTPKKTTVKRKAGNA